MKQIIAIQGFKGTGKDEIAKYINYILNTPLWMHMYWLAKLLKFKPLVHKWKITRYASCLKRMLAIMMNIDINRFEDQDFKANYYFNFNTYQLLNINETSINNTITDKYFSRELKRNNLNIALQYTLSIRQILQFFGTDVMRKIFGDKLWINCTLNSKDMNLIIADQRFIIENDEVTNSNYITYIIHVIRKGCNIGEHVSEQEIKNLFDNKKYDILLENDGSLKDLFYKCKNIIYSNLL